MYSWEDRFCALIERHRADEMGARRHLAKLLSFSRSYMMAVPLLVNVAAFVGYAVSDGEIKASTLFAALAAFSNLRFPLMFYPMALASLAQARVSRTRLAGLLALAETAAHDSARQDLQSTAPAVERARKSSKERVRKTTKERYEVMAAAKERVRKTTKEQYEMMEAGEAVVVVSVGDEGAAVGSPAGSPRPHSAAVAESGTVGGVAVGIRGGKFWWAEPAPSNAAELGGGAAPARPRTRSA